MTICNYMCSVHLPLWLRIVLGVVAVLLIVIAIATYMLERKD